MRHLLATLTFLAITTMVAAQRPWGEFSVKQQQRILSSKGVPEEVRSIIVRCDELTESERLAAWEVVAEWGPQKSKKLSSPYLYLYECLRPENGLAARSDVALLQRYPKYMLARWGDDGHDFDLYNYAYSVAKLCATDATVEPAAIVRSLKKGASRHSEKLVATFDHCLSVATESLAQGLSVAHISTELNPYDISVAEIDAAIYGVADALYATPRYNRLTTTDDIIIAEELMAFEGAYYEAVPSEVCEELSLKMIWCWSAYDSSMVLADNTGEQYMLPAMLYLLPDGHIYALRVDQASNVESLVVGCVEEGRLRILGEMAVEMGVLQGVKCNSEGLYISVERGGKSLYYLVSAI